MSTPESDIPDPEDMFSDTRMSFGDHIEDLRTHLLRALKGFALGMIIALWPLGPYVLRIIVAPVEEQLDAFEKRKRDKAHAEAAERVAAGGMELPVIRADLKINLVDLHGIIDKNDTDAPVLDVMTAGFEQLLINLDAIDMLDEENKKALTQVKRRSSNFVTLRATFADPIAISGKVQDVTAQVQGARLSTMSITEAFMVYLKVAGLTGLVLSSPWVFWNIWMFIAAGLYPHEKRLVHVYLPFSLVLFISGVLVCQFLVMPRAIGAMLWFNEWLGLDADLRLTEWLGFALMMPLVFGISFQTPLVMMFAHRVGMVTVQTYREKRRMAWFLMAVFAALITPSVDAMSMMFLWVPMGALYELGILLCVWQGEQDDLAEWEKEDQAKELVEV